MSSVSFDLSNEERETVRDIARRYCALAALARCSRLDIEMSIAACHANGCPLRLGDLMAADKLDFVHDVAGILYRIDHNTGKLKRNFVPRFAVGNKEESSV